IDSVLRRLGHDSTPVQADFAAGDEVEIIGGAFEGSTGKVESMDDEKQEALVSLIIFGRETSTEIPYGDLKKVGE
ncbi:KOW motif-containing protein, partial [Faecalibaculum rodentium]